MNRFKVLLISILLVLIVTIIHELGHAVVYIITNPVLVEKGLYPIISFKGFGMSTYVYYVKEDFFSQFWPVAGGFIFTFPLVLYWRIIDIKKASTSQLAYGCIIIGLVMYGLIEVLFFLA
jgi:hypothetical protein